MTNKNTLPLIMSIVIAALFIGVSVLWINYHKKTLELGTTFSELLIEKAENVKLRNDIDQTKYCLSTIESGSTDFTISRCKLMLGK